MPYGTPAEMSPYQNQNKGYAKQERKDLLKDNPVARDASGGRPWISKHFKSSMSPLKDGHSAMEMEAPMKKHHSAMKMNHDESPAEFNPGLRAAAKAGKLDDNPKFKAAVMGSAAKMDAKVVKKVYKKKQ